MVASRGDAGQPLVQAFGGQLVKGYAEAAAQAGGLVDAVYIATPPALHLEHTLACINAGVAVLVEKPFAANSREAAQMGEAATARGVFAMEGMWTLFMPALRRLREVIDTGSIGEPLMVTGGFSQSYQPDPDHGNFDPARGGGALAHLGYYPLALGQWLFGEAVSARAEGRIGLTGVDENVAIALRYASGVTAAFHTSLRVSGENSFTVHGTHGRVALDGPIYRPLGIRVTTVVPSGRPVVALTRKAIFKEGHLWGQISQWRERHARRGRVEAVPFAGNGYHYEAQEVERCVRDSRLQSEVMPLAHSLSLATLMENLRGQLQESGK